MDIGFIGLGSMGAEMARRLIDAGHRVTVWNRSPGPAEAAAEAGAIRANEPAQAAANEFIISMLSNDAAIDAVFTPELIASMPSGALHLNMATVSVECGERTARAHEAAGVAYLAAPVLGRPEAAAAGQLTIVAGGSADDVARAQPIFDHLGRRVWHVSEQAASANLVKIGVNFNLIHALQSLAESITLVEAGGIDGSQFAELLQDSLFPGPVYGGYGGMIATRTYDPPAFNVALGRKDLRLAQDAAASSGVALPSAPVLAEIFDEALADDALAPHDWAAVAEITRRRSSSPQ